MDEQTVAVYEARAEEWRDRRAARYLDRAECSRARGARPATVVADLGCGAGLHLPYLPRPAVALDAGVGDGRRSRARPRPTCPASSGDLEALPFRRGALGGAWARASYLHVPRDRLPWALMELHHALAVGAPAHLTMMRGRRRRPVPRRRLRRALLRALATRRHRATCSTGAGFDVVDTLPTTGRRNDWLHVLVRRARTLPDFVGPGMRLLVCGLNPSLHAADAGVGFVTLEQPVLARRARRRHRHARPRSPARLPPPRRRHDRPREARVASRAKEITAAEYRDGAARVERIVAGSNPARSASSASPATASPSTATRNRACSRTRSAASPPT